MPELNETKKKFDRLRRDPKAREIARLRDKALSDYNTAIDVARKEGRAEGKHEGIEQGIKKGQAKAIDTVIHNLLTSPQTAGLADEVIAKLAGADVTHVATLRKQLLKGG